MRISNGEEEEEEERRRGRMVRYGSYEIKEDKNG
jgi:hypothetical protein